ncbi:MAG: hypothetical protein K2J08_10790, partial [Ruminococcus sp.]|nr:hypothetical protein [Ruminococcus sp.]
MFKKVLAGTTAILLLASISPIMNITHTKGNDSISANIPSTLRSSVTIDAEDGTLTLISSGARDEKINTFCLTLISTEAINFQFCKDVGSKFDIYSATESDDLKSVNIFAYKKEALFGKDGSVVIGTVKNPSSVKAEYIEYTWCNESIVLNGDEKTYIPQTIDADANVADPYGLSIGDTFQNLECQLLTTSTTTTPATTTASQPVNVDILTETTVTNTTAPKTTVTRKTTTTEAETTAETTATTTAPVTRKAARPENIFTTTTTTEPETTTSTTTETSTTTTTTEPETTTSTTTTTSATTAEPETTTSTTSTTEPETTTSTTTTTSATTTAAPETTAGAPAGWAKS